MTRRQWIVAVVAATLWVIGPAIPRAIIINQRIGPVPDTTVLLLLLWGILPNPPTAPALAATAGRLRRWFGTWRTWFVAAPWAFLVAFAVARSIARYATNEDLAMYDAALLSRHLYILGRDLFGAGATALLALVFVSPALVWALGALIAARLEVAAARLGRRRSGIGVGVALAVGLVGSVFTAGRWFTPAVVDNAAESYGMYTEVTSELTQRSHRDLDLLELPEKPDVVFYVIESYGRVVADDTDYLPQWRAAIEALGGEAATGGWSAASGWSTSPVQGGRSWIADESLLTGLYVAHQATFEHVDALLPTLPTMPRFFDTQGYTTVLVKPSDRERPGVALENPFQFEQTVFAAELEYRGPLIGWGRIPDQYTIERVQEKVIDPLIDADQPVFAFFHLATAHVPWTPAPQLVAHWADWNRIAGRQVPLVAQRTFESEFWLRVSRFKRGDRGAGERAAEDGQHEHYIADIVYDLRAIGRRLSAGARRPTLVIVMGDHQPPVVAKEGAGEVPVHLFASDPRLLAPFLAEGWTAGPLPAGRKATLAHHDLFPTIAQALAAIPAEAPVPVSVPGSPAPSDGPAPAGGPPTVVSPSPPPPATPGAP
ncbi:MAG: sulfatase-like hydrolase/transferase [Myxococcota bacterium]